MLKLKYNNRGKAIRWLITRIQSPVLSAPEVILTDTAWD